MVTKVRAESIRKEKKFKATSPVALTADDEKTKELRKRASVLLGQEIRFIYSSDFEAKGKSDSAIVTAERLLEELQNCGDAISEKSASQSGGESEGLLLLQDWRASAPLLTFEQEQILFKALNLLRYRINRVRSRLSDSSPSEKDIQRIEMKMELIERIRTQLVNSNLRLVASIARKFSSSYGDVDDFSSDGCMILLGAIDRFDYSRKFRFSTYATHSIQRHFFRAWKIRQRRKERFPNAASEILSELPQQVEQSPVCDDPEMVVGRLLSQAESLLDEREHQILLERFGLGGRNKEGRTLREIASDLGISKERVRQLQMKALEKLRQILDPEYLNQDCLPELC
jgi:RNA polymerase sigma factor (sigma-70 family)